MYSGLMYTKPDSPDKVDCKGIFLVRRGTCGLVKDISDYILNTMFYERDPDKCVHKVQETVCDLFNNKVPFDKLVLTKSLKLNYKNNNQPHVIVASKVNNCQDNNLHYAAGDRVPYVFVEGNSLDKQACLNAEHPDFIDGVSTRIDAMYYLEHQIKNPVLNLMHGMLPEESEQQMFDLSHCQQAVLDRQQRIMKTTRTVKNQRNKQHEITKFLSKKLTI